MHFPLYIPAWDRILSAASINCARPVLAVDLFSENWVIELLNTSGFSVSFSVPPCWVTENIPSWSYLFTADRMLSCDFCVSFSSLFAMGASHELVSTTSLSFLKSVFLTCQMVLFAALFPINHRLFNFTFVPSKLFLCHVLNQFCLIT